MSWRHAIVVTATGLAIGAGIAPASTPGSGQARWVVRDLGAPPDSSAEAINARGQIVGAHQAVAPGAYRGCRDPFLWEDGRLTTTRKDVPERLDDCRGDMWVANVPIAITVGGRVLGFTDRGGWTGGFFSYWLWPPLPSLEKIFGASYPVLPIPKGGQRARTCWLEAGGRTVCGTFRPAYGRAVAGQCTSQQDTVAVGINDRPDLVAYLTACQDVDTGEVRGPRSYILAGPDGWTTFGRRGQGAINALNARGEVVGAMGVPGGESHAFLWNRTRIIDLGTLGGKLSRATALNDRSQVVGTSTTRAGAQHGFLWRNGRMIDIGAVSPIAINARGDVLSVRRVGSLLRGNSRLRVFLWSGGRQSDLGYWRSRPNLNLDADYGVSLDDDGRVAGADEAGHALVWEDGRRTALPQLAGGKQSAARDAHATAGIVGWSTNENGVQRAVLWTLQSR